MVGKWVALKVVVKVVRSEFLLVVSMVDEMAVEMVGMMVVLLVE